MKPNHWKQKTPQDQLTVIAMSLEGAFDNLKENIITQDRYIAQAKPLLSDLQALIPYIRGEQKWDFE